MADEFRHRLLALMPARDNLNVLGLVKKVVVGPDVQFLLDKMLYAYFTQCNYDECTELCQWLLNISWEKLNTGYWKDVELSWRCIYSLVSLFKAVSLLFIRESDINMALYTCDMGLLLGAPIHDNILAKLAAIIIAEKSRTNKRLACSDGGNETLSSTSKHLKTSHVPLLNEDKYVTNIYCPSVQYFNEKYFIRKLPVLIHNAVNYWPAFTTRKWSIDYIKKIAGARTVPIELGTKYTEDNWSQQLMTVSQFIDKYIVNVQLDHESIGYLAQHQLFDQIPELREDIAVPTYCCLGETDDVDINAWFGPMGTVSPLHQDPKHNLLVQVIGEKYIRLYNEDYSHLLYAHEGTLLTNTSQVDVENPDLRKFPKFCEAPYLECILKSGDMLYIPPKCWHYVRSLSLSFSVSFWFE